MRRNPTGLLVILGCLCCPHPVTAAPDETTFRVRIGGGTTPITGSEHAGGDDAGWDSGPGFNLGVETRPRRGVTWVVRIETQRFPMIADAYRQASGGPYNPEGLEDGRATVTTVMGGPQARIGSRRVCVYLEALFGWQHSSMHFEYRAPMQPPSFPIQQDGSHEDVTGALGSGIDVALMSSLGAFLDVHVDWTPILGYQHLSLPIRAGVTWP